MSISAPRKFNSAALFPCALVRVQISFNRYVLAHALIDRCSQTNLVTESFVRCRRFIKIPAKTNITGTDPVVGSSHAVELTISSQYSNYTFTFTIDVK